MVKTLGDYIREAEAQRNLENSYWYMPQCKIPVSSPPYDPYLNYWDDYEPPPYFSHWDNYESLQVQRQEEEKPDATELLVKSMEHTIERLDNIENKLSKISDMIALATRLAQETSYSQTEQYKDSILSSDEEFSEEANLEEESLKKDEETPTEVSQIKMMTPNEGSQIEITDFIDESICEENEKDPLVLDLEKIPIFGQIVLTIGDAVIEVHGGKVNLKSGKEEDVIKVLNFNENFSPFTSHYFDDVVETNIVSDLKMQDPLKKITILQDPSIVVDEDKIKKSPSFEVHPPRGKRTNNVNHMVRKLRRCTALDVKFALGEPLD